jgi:hypothetical protein
VEVVEVVETVETVESDGRMKHRSPKGENPESLGKDADH